MSCAAPHHLSWALRLSVVITFLCAAATSQAQDYRPSAYLTTEKGGPIAKLIEEDKAEELAKLLKAGLYPDAVIPTFGGHDKGRLLEYACQLSKPAVIRLLVQQGADVYTCGPARILPIEIVLKEKREDLAKLLEITPRQFTEPELYDMLAFRLLAPSYLRDHKEPLWIFINGAPPRPGLKQLLEASGFKLESRKEKAEALTAQLDFAFADATKTRVTFSFSHSSGPLSGGFTKGVFSLKYGYWLITEQTGGDF